MLIFLTDFADQAVLLPVSAAVLLVLAAGRWRRGALVWGAATGGVTGVMLLLKIVVSACGAAWAWRGLGSPSGHTAGAATVYGGLVCLALAMAGRKPWPGIAVAVLVAATIGLTRVALGMHSRPDVILGAVVGVAGTAALAWWLGRPAQPMRARRLVLPVCALLIALHGQHLQAEAGIRALALDIWPLNRCHPG